MFQPERIRALLVLGICLAATPAIIAPASANDIENRLEAVQQDLDKSREKRANLDKAARKAAAELRAVKRQGVNLARKMHRHSADADRIEAQLNSLEERERTKTEKMQQRKAQLSVTLAALQRLARMPTATLVAVPQSTDKTIRTAILLRAAVPELQRDAMSLGDDLRALTSLRDQISADKVALTDSLARLKAERKSLAALTSDKFKLLKNMKSAERAAAQKAARLSARAGNLRELLEKLSIRQNRPALRAPGSAPVALIPVPARKPAVTPPVTISRGVLPAPGRVVTTFGAKMPNGTLSKGVFVITRPSAAVVAPIPGRVVFAGQFRGYGNLVILELRDKGHALISGMSRIDAQVGDDVLVGEPLGEMTPSTGTAPKLYFELRRRGRPINPMPSDTARRNKVSG
ncbi:MAG: peptidoglycan DD-metalloendopeptidase family protein [Rhodospirillaceae bacterium]|nr:peptidoglycan DD-metalloendopeptidase family protein [Rhodospirillaceae bacterium]